VAVALALVSPVLAYDFGRQATPDEIALWDIDVRPDGKGLPPGSGMRIPIDVAQDSEMISPTIPI
jgi:hypothetical protein